MKAQFYILGLLLRYGPQHGYMLKQTVENQISDFAQIKLPTIYYHLEKLSENGYIDATCERDGNRPEKTVYRITESGEKYFYILLKKMQSEVLRLDLPFDGILYFHDKIHPDEFSYSVKTAIQTLESKLKQLHAHREEVLNIIPDCSRACTKAIFNHHIYHLQAELNWFKDIERGI